MILAIYFTVTADLLLYRPIMIRHRRAEHDNPEICAVITWRHSQAMSPSTFSISISVTMNMPKFIYCRSYIISGVISVEIIVADHHEL